MTLSFRSDIEKPECPDEWAYFNPGPGKKRICLITREGYKNVLKEPVYPCTLNAGYNPKKDPVFQTGPVFGSCRADPFNGTKARIQERAVCSKLGHKPYEPPWKTLEVESVEDWWGLFALKASSHAPPRLGRTGVVILDGERLTERLVHYGQFFIFPFPQVPPDLLKIFHLFY